MNLRKSIIWTLIVAVAVILLGCVLLKWNSCTEKGLAIHQVTTR